MDTKIGTRRAARLAARGLLALVLLPACETANLSNTEGQYLVAIRLEPASATLTLNQGKVVQRGFRAFGTWAARGDGAVGGREMEITDEATWAVLDPQVGRMQVNQFRTEVKGSSGKYAAPVQGGTTKVTATMGEVSGGAVLKVIYKANYFGPKAPKDAGARFGGATDPARAPVIIYPASGTLAPPNLRQLEVQWQKGGNDLFEVRIQSALCDIRAYTTDRAYNLADASWQAVAGTNREGSVTVTVRGTAAKGGAKVGVSKAVTLKLSRSDVRGGMYYWVAQDKGGIFRFDFNKASAKAEAYYTTNDAGVCVGCHTMSPQGKKIAFTRKGTEGQASVFDVATRKALNAKTYQASFQTFSPDETQVIVANAGELFRRDVATGKVLDKLATSHQGAATHPDWSADGKSLVYVSTAWDKLKNDHDFSDGSITLLRRDTQGQWHPPKVLVQGGGGTSNYYPSFSPGGEWIIFNRSTGNSYSDLDANLFIVSPSGGKPLALASVNESKVSNSWPRWSPFLQTYKGSGIYWITFSSVRDYGFRLKNSLKGAPVDMVPQIWMTSFNRDLAAKGKDPTTPPVWLPFQSLSGHNHIAQWTTKIIDVK